MIIIENSILTENTNDISISSQIEVAGKKEILWYSVPVEFRHYLVTERLDAFVVGLLFLALKTGNDIQIKGSISQQLLYSLNHYVINALCRANSTFKKIKVLADAVDTKDLNIERTAGTGLSCGVDSFATYYDHLGEKGAYEIKYFTFFNVGSHGDFGGENARQNFENRYKDVKRVAEKLRKGIIPVDSNISELLRMNFLQTSTVRNVSCVLLLQKLFGNYYLASQNRFDFFKLHAHNNQDYDTLILNLLSTESTSFYSAVSHLDRLERTSLISSFPEPRLHLDVCTNPNHTRPTKNCSSCDKCLRTAFTLDLLGKLDLYEQVFDLEEYSRYKKHYIGKVLATKDKDQFSKEIYGLMKETGQISARQYYNLFNYKRRSLKKRVKYFIKSI